MVPETNENNSSELRFATGLQTCSRKAFCKKRSKAVIHPRS
jgi:hypothetical protein